MLHRHLRSSPSLFLLQGAAVMASGNIGVANSRQPLRLLHPFQISFGRGIKNFLLYPFVPLLVLSPNSSFQHAHGRTALELEHSLPPFHLLWFSPCPPSFLSLRLIPNLIKIQRNRAVRSNAFLSGSLNQLLFFLPICPFP